MLLYESGDLLWSISFGVAEVPAAVRSLADRSLHLLKVAGRLEKKENPEVRPNNPNVPLVPLVVRNPGGAKPLQL